MATAAFKSTTRRTSIGGDSVLNSNSNSNSNSSSIPSSSSSATPSARHHRRSRSVSRFSHRLPVEDAAEDHPPSATRRGKFVNTVRGSEFPEISLDDLAIEMFSLTSSPSEVSSSANNDCDGAATQRRGRSSASVGDVDKTASQRRGRSVSRRGSRVGELRNTNNNNSKSDLNKISKNNDLGEKNGGFDNGSIRRRRSLSVAPKSYSLICDSENEHSQKNRRRADSTLQNPLQKSTPSSQQRGLRRCNSQKDLFRSYDGYSSYSSTLTDDEGNNSRHIGHGIEKGLQAAPAFHKGPHISSRDQNNGWYKAVQKEYTHPSIDNRLHMLKDDNKLPDLAVNNARRSADSDVLKAVSTIRRNCKTKLEESEKRKEELLAEIMLEEERGKELKKIVGDLLPTGKETSPAKRPMRGRKRSTDRTRVSKQLVEEADRIIEDFISSVEETDMSSFDGERSDTSSIVGGAIRPMMQYGDMDPFRNSLRSDLQSGEMDGVVLPWLKWETGDAGCPPPGNDIKQHPATPKTVLQDALEEMAGGTEQEQSVNSKSSRGSWSPGAVNSFCMDAASRTGEVESCKNQLLSQVPRRSRVDIDDYLKPSSNEDTVSEIWRQRNRIHSGGLLICNGGSFGKFLV